MFDTISNRLIEIHRVRSVLKPWTSPAFCIPSETRPEGAQDRFSQDQHAKVLVSGMPKAGNNWLMGLVAHCLDLNVVDGIRTPGKGVCMTHQSFAANLYLNKNIHFGVYMLRDLRDIVCSFYHYVNKKPGIAGIAGSEGPVFRDMENFYFQNFLSRLVRRYDIPGHVDGYVRYGLPVVRYERLLDDPVSELSQLFRHWNVEIEPDRLREAIDANSFDKLKESGKNERGHTLSASHMRKGQKGSFVDELPASVLEDIERRFGNYLLRWGYPLTTV